MKQKYVVPKHIRERYNVTTREWKTMKRREVGLLEAALKDVYRGSAFFPRPDLTDEIKALIVQLKVSMSVKNWGR